MADNLPALVQALPIELFDEILMLTVIALIRPLGLCFTRPNQPRTIDEEYKPPMMLQIDRKSRAQFADAFYRNTPTFYVSSLLAATWIRSLPKCHLDLIADIRLSDVMAQKRSSEPRLMVTIRGIQVDEEENRLLCDLWRISDSIEANAIKVRVAPMHGMITWTALDKMMRGDF